jgi:hypothetical protein
LALKGPKQRNCAPLPGLPGKAQEWQDFPCLGFFNSFIQFHGMKLFSALFFLLLASGVAFSYATTLPGCIQECQEDYDSAVAAAQSTAAAGQYTESVAYGGTCPRTSVYGGSGHYANLAKCVAVQQICIDEGGSDCHSQLQSCCLEEAILSATNALSNCKANCELRFKDSAPVPPPTQPDETPSLPPCSSSLGTIFSVEGSPKLIRGTVSVPISEGQQYCLDDIIETSQGERLFINFNDGNIRFVGGASKMSIRDDDAADEEGPITRAIGIIEHIVRDDAAKLNYDTICGGRALFSEGTQKMECRDSLRYTPHSSVRYEFTSHSDKITVFEGYVEALDISTGEYTVVEGGEQYSRAPGAPLGEASIYSVDVSSVPRTLSESESGSGGCCGPAIILLAAAFFAGRG